MTGIQFSSFLILLLAYSFCQQNGWHSVVAKGKIDDPLEELLSKFSTLKGVKEKNLCKGTEHYSSFSYTCCAGKTYPVGISFDENFSGCFTGPKSAFKKEAVNESMWRLYDCLLGNSAADLEKFATKMSTNFPDDVKKNIMGNITDISQNLVEDGKKRQYMRAVYHYVERGVCENNYQRPVVPELLKCDDGKDNIRENLHSRGDCCGKNVVPLPLELFRRPPSLAIRKCTKTLMYTLPQKPIYYMDVDFEQSDAQQLCQTACILQELKMLGENVKLKPDIRMNAEHQPVSEFVFEPKPAMRQLIKLFSNATGTKFGEQFDFASPVNFTDARTEDIYDVVEHIRISEFWENVTRYEIEPALVQCQAYNHIVQELETVLYKYCQDEIKV